MPRALRAARAACWLLPVAFLALLYSKAFSVWFMADDFAWLSLLRLVHQQHDLLHELFAPMAQGTIRPWSERGYFMLLEWLFGLESLPFRIAAFATAAGVVLLVAWVTVRATGSRVAGFVAPFLWMVNTALVRAMTWSSTYNELMCPLFLLSALALFIRYRETGRRSLWWWQLVVFSLGFGALEINIVYPAIVAAWVLFLPADGQADSSLQRLRAALPDILPLAGVSVVYFVVHRLAAPLPQSGDYALRFDLSIFRTLALYGKWSLTPEPMLRFGHSHFAEVATLLVCLTALAGYVTAEIRKRRYAVLFFGAWFILTLAPVLLLPNHLSDYYLTIPVIGLAMLGGAAAGQYWNGPFARRAMMAIPLGLYLFNMIPVTRAVTAWWLGQSAGVRTLVLGVTAARQTHPGKAIVLSGVTTKLFNLSLADQPFVVSGIEDVYLTPESALSIHPDDGTIDLDPLVLPVETLWHGITHEEVVVYSLESDHLRNITEGYTRRMAEQMGRSVGRLPSRVDAGNSLDSWLLGPSWLPPDSGVRWMPGSATLRIGVPEGATRLELDGTCPESDLLSAPRHLMVLADGVLVGDTRIYDPETSFQRLFPMPGVLAGKTLVDIEIRVDPVDRKDGQDYGLVFGKIKIEP